MSLKPYHALAMLPLLSILSLSPMKLQSHFQGRAIASIEEVKESAYPKYEARASKIDRSKIEVDKDMDLSCFSDQADSYRKDLLQERQDYKVDLIDKDGTEAQKLKIQSLVQRLVELEEDVKFLKDKKAWDPTGEEIADKSMKELKVTLESLLQDEVENELNVLKAQMKKDETPVVVKEEPKKEEPKKEEPKKDEPQAEQDKKICELEDQNKVLTKQVEDLLQQQKTIMETMVGMNQMMIQMNERSQQQQPYSIPGWMMSGSMVNPGLQYPYYQASPTVIIMNSNQTSDAAGPFMGQNSLQQSMQSGQYQMQYQQQYQQPSYGSPYPNSFMNVDPRFSMPSPVMPGSFGQDPLLYNFGPGPKNQLPILSA